MAYQAFYRVWRPQTFGELVGQEHVSRTLKNAVVNDRIAHAYLFCGPRGTGKTTSARILAKAVNCQEPVGGEPCNKCHNCLAVNNGSSVDVIEIDAASNRGIDEIKSLRERVKFSPSNSRYRAYIIDEVHMLSHDAFNAFLKTLEEPPAHVIFILATTEAHKVPLTILSRCQRFDFRRIGEEEISARLAEIAAAAGLEVEREAYHIIARAAEGGLRDAISILDQAAATGEKAVTVQQIHDLLGTVTAETVAAVADHLVHGRTARVLELVAELEKWGKDPKLFLRELAGHLRRLLLQELAGTGDSPGSRLWYVLHMLTEAEQSLKGASQPGLVLELALIRASHQEWGFLPEEMHQRMEKVEQRLAARGGVAAPVPAQVVPAQAVPAQAAGVKKKDEKRTGEKPSIQAAPPPVEDKPLMPAAQPPVKEKQTSERGGKTAPDPGPAAPGPAQGEPLARMLQLWPAVLEKVKAENPHLFNFVRKANPVQVDGDRLVLGFARGDEFFREYFERGDFAAGLAGLLSGVCPGNWRIGSTLAGETDPGPVPKKSETVQDETGFYLEKLFDAQHVKDGSDPRRIGGGKKGG
ncbi:MAG TPA: DNA polymerase III subunit gamma/tau [Spirochaetia bacterium]|nr:DNA polymerase III subunit gamma/tau [Spirochaetia bacterium]